jgi:hypothetical protein
MPYLDDRVCMSMFCAHVLDSVDGCHVYEFGKPALFVELSQENNC